MRPTKPSSSPPSDPKPQRIAKVMADAGLCSRREAERWIEEGRVSVNGIRLKTPAVTVTSQDRVTVDGKPLRGAQAGHTKKTRLWMMNKPSGWITTTKDPQGRPTVFDHIPKKIGRVVSVGRLDINSEGLLLFTNDGGLSRVLELPSTGLPRHYRVRVHGRVTDDYLEELADGITVDGIAYGPIQAYVEKGRGANTWLHVTLHEGKNREIRNVMRALDLQVSRLIRMAYGPIELGDLPLGKIIEIPAAQVTRLMQQVGYAACD
jgi:23S rRNA pseudouridine2605 synthase